MLLTIFVLSSLLSLVTLPIAIETCRARRFLGMLVLLGAGAFFAGFLFGISVWLVSGDPNAGISAGGIVSGAWAAGLGPFGGRSVVRGRRQANAEA